MVDVEEKQVSYLVSEENLTYVSFGLDYLCRLELLLNFGMWSF